MLKPERTETSYNPEFFADENNKFANSNAQKVSEHQAMYKSPVFANYGRFTFKIDPLSEYTPYDEMTFLLSPAEIDAVYPKQLIDNL